MSVSKTTDGGTSWGVRRSLGDGGDYPTACWDITVAPGDSAIVYAGGQEGGRPKILRSSDAGNSWEDITENLASLHSSYDTVYALWVSPYDPETVLAGTSGGVFAGTTRLVGRYAKTSWSPTPLSHSTRALAYYQAKETVYAATESQGVYCSADGGATWRPLNDGLGCLETLCIGLDSENGLLFVGTDGGAVWRTGIIDLNDDGAVDFNDFAIFSENWMCTCSGPDWCRSCDLNSSGKVDFEDLLNLANHWLR